MTEAEETRIRKLVRKHPWLSYAVVSLFFILYVVVASYGIARYLQQKQTNQVNAFIYKACRAQQQPNSPASVLRDTFLGNANAAAIRSNHESPALATIDRAAVRRNQFAARNLVPKTCSAHTFR